MGFLHDVFTIIKFIFGLGAFFALVGIGFMLLWFLMHLIVRSILHGQPADRCSGLRKLFLEP